MPNRVPEVKKDATAAAAVALALAVQVRALVSAPWHVASVPRWRSDARLKQSHASQTAGRPRQPGHPYTRPCKQPQQRQRRSWNASAPAMRTHAQGTQKGASLAIPSLHTTYHIPPHDSLWVAHPVATEDMSRVKHSLKPIQCGCGTAMAHWSRPQTSNFCIAPVPPKWLLCARPEGDKSLKRVNRNHMAHPKGANPGHIICRWSPPGVAV